MKWKDTLVLDYDLWMVTREVKGLLQGDLWWKKVDSHVEDKRKEDPQCKLQGNKHA